MTRTLAERATGKRPYAEVIGDPIAHSKSPLIHGFWLGKLGIDADYRAQRVRSDQLASFLAGRRADPDWRGCNVTMPLKQSVASFLDDVDPLASTVGAINMIVAANDRLVGGNSDVDGVREAIASAAHNPCANHVATLIDLAGTGGAARAVMVALTGEEVTVFGRDKAKADALADELGIGSSLGFSAALSVLDEAEFSFDPDFPDVKPNRGADQRYDHIVINATSLGMRGKPALPINLRRYPQNTIVIDLVYDPLATPLLKQARDLGMVTVDGLVMLVGQAAIAFEKFFGQPAPREHDAELRRLLTA